MHSTFRVPADTGLAQQAADRTGSGGGPARLTCISPAQLLAVKVKGQTVGEPKVIFHQDAPSRPVHVGRFNLGSIPVPVCPVQPPAAGRSSETNQSGQEPLPVRAVPVDRVGDDGPRVHQLRVEEDAALAAVQFGHLHRVPQGIGPEEEAGHVVQRQAFGAPQV